MKQANPINITHIDHVVIRANNLENMIAFYRDVLGCKLERGPGDGGLAQLRAGLSLIDLVDAQGPIGRHSGNVEDVVKITLLIKNHDDQKLQYLVKKRKAVFGDSPPTSTLIPVPALALESLEFEIDAIVVTPNQ
jgi:catechol 2,3-dioxygenase-like lactoylglutathione lyase family enzyme